MRVYLRNPGIAYRDCAHCIKYLYCEDTNQVVRNQAGEPIVRLAGNNPPCRQVGASCDKGTPENNLNHTPENRLAYQHYRECKAIGVFPDDPIVRHNAAILTEAEADCRDEDWNRFRISALQILTAGMSR